jgi:hypothetical protein
VDTHLRVLAHDLLIATKERRGNAHARRVCAIHVRLLYSLIVGRTASIVKSQSATK